MGVTNYADALDIIQPGIVHTNDIPEIDPDTCSQSKSADNFIDNLDDDTLLKLIQGIGDTECKRLLENELDTISNAASASALGITPYGGAGGDIRSKSATEHLKTFAYDQGCDTVFYNQINTAMVFLSSTCSVKTAKTETKLDFQKVSVISINVGPTDAMTEAHTEIIRIYREYWKDALNSDNTEKVKMQAIKEAGNFISEAQRKWDFSVSDSTFTISNKVAVDMAVTNDVKISEDAEIIDSIKNKVKSEAALDISKRADMGSPPENLKSFIQDKFSQMGDSRFEAIVKQVNENKFTINSRGEITLNVNGALKNVHVLLDDSNMVYLRSNVLMEATLNLAKEVANETVLDIMSKSSAELVALGLSDLQKQIADGLAKQTTNDGPLGGGGLFGGMFGGIFGGSAIFILLGGFIVYKLTLGGGLADIGTKIAIILIIVVVLYFGSAYMFSLWPFEDTPDNRIKNFNPIYTNANKLTNKLTNNNTKTPYSRRNQPYVEFNGYQGKLKRTQSSSKYQGEYLKRNKKSSKPYK